MTQKIEKLDVSKILENSNAEVDPEKLASFKISTNEEEKKAKDQLVLPYLPKYVFSCFRDFNFINTLVLEHLIMCVS